MKVMITKWIWTIDNPSIDCFFIDTSLMGESMVFYFYYNSILFLEMAESAYNFFVDIHRLLLYIGTEIENRFQSIIIVWG